MSNSNHPVTALALGAVLATPTAGLAVTDEEFNDLKMQFEALADHVEQTSSDSGSDVHIGGYGELHYNDWEKPDGSTKKELDFHRFVLFFGYDYTDDIRFHSELELEHALAGDGAPGEVELEQAYVEFDLTDNVSAKGGLFLIPVGILNETHEPPTFYGVERNPIEKNIIPTTWWEGGAALTGRVGASGISYDFAVSSGLDGGTSIRGGRQKVAEAKADDLAYTGRLKYTGMPGLELAGTVNYQSDITQSTDPTVNDATLLSAHAIYDFSQFQLRALYASWDIDVTSAATATDQAKDKQDGYFVEGSWRPLSAFGVFARYNVWDNGGLGDTEQTQTDVGFNYWPHEDVVIKFDIQSQSHGDALAANEYDGFNLGIGYQF